MTKLISLISRDPLLVLAALLAAVCLAAASWRFGYRRGGAKEAGKASSRPAALPAQQPMAEHLASAAELTAARRLLAAGEFAEADRCAREAALKNNSAEALRLAEQCAFFNRLVREIGPAAADAAEICEVKLRPESEPIIARVTTDEDGTLRIRPEKGIVFSRRREEITSLRPLAPDEIDKRKRERLVAAKLAAGADGVSLALLGLQAWADGLKPEAAALLQEAIKADPDLQSSLAEHQARQMLRHGVWLQSIGASAKGEETVRQVASRYPGTRAAEAAQKILAEMAGGLPLARQAAAAQTKAEVGAPPAQPLAGDLTAADQDLRRAKALLAEAQETADAKDSDRCYAEAVKLLEHARAIYEAACAQNPDDAKLTRRMEEIQAQLYWARKLQRL